MSLESGTPHLKSRPMSSSPVEAQPSEPFLVEPVPSIYKHPQSPVAFFLNPPTIDVLRTSYDGTSGAFGVDDANSAERIGSWTVSEFQPGVWTQLYDSNHNPLPLTLNVTPPATVYAAWYQAEVPAGRPITAFPSDSIVPTVGGAEAHSTASRLATDDESVSAGVEGADVRGASTSWDVAFNGVWAVAVRDGDAVCVASSLCVRPNGSVLVAGHAQQVDGPTRMAVVQLSKTGKVDRRFGLDGWEVIEVPQFATAVNSAALQDDGMVILAGEASDLERDKKCFALVRIQAHGVVDSSFGRGGLVLTDVSSVGDDVACAVAIQDDGKIVVAGFTNGPDDSGAAATARMGGRRSTSKPRKATEVSDYVVARYDEYGDLDATFGEHGIVRTRFDGRLAQASGLAILSSGEILVAGTARDSASAEGTAAFAVVRYRSDGSIDSTFGTRGRSVVDGAGSGEAHAVVVQDDGKIVIVGAVTDVGGDGHQFAVVRLDSSGHPDRSFNKAAAATVQGEAHGVAIQSDGAILVAGCATLGKRDLFAVARFDHTGRLDDTFGAHGVEILELGGQVDCAKAIAIDAQQRVIIAGTSQASTTDVRFAAARLLPHADELRSREASEPDRAQQKRELEAARRLEWAGQGLQAEAEYQRLAEAGYIDATFALHLDLRNRDLDEALYWLRVIARQIDLLWPGVLPTAMSEALQKDASLELKAAPWDEDEADVDLDSLGDAYLDLGLSFVDAGRREEGERLIEESALLGYSPGYYHWGLVLLDRGKRAEAERWIRRAAEDDVEEAVEKLRELR